MLKLFKITLITNFSDRRLNRDFDNRFPNLTRHVFPDDDEDFFQPSLIHTKEPNQDYFRNSPGRDLFSAHHARQKQHSPEQQTQNQQPITVNHTQTRVSPPKPSESTFSNELPNPVNPTHAKLIDNNRQSPITVIHGRTDSPRRFTTHTTIQPNQFQSQQPQPPTEPQQPDPVKAHPRGVPIKIQHISTSPHKSDFTSLTPEPESNLSRTPIKVVNEPTRINVGQPQQQQPVYPATAAKNPEPRPTGNQSDFAVPLDKTHHKSPSPQQEQKTEPQYQPQHQPKTVLKTAQDKCEDVLHELTKLEKEVGEFVGKKTDKKYLRLEELLTRCLLQLDEIDRSDDKINQIRRKLINYTNLLADKLEAIATMHHSSLNDCIGENKTIDNSNDNKKVDSENSNEKLDSNSNSNEAKANVVNSSDNQNINETSINNNNASNLQQS